MRFPKLKARPTPKSMPEPTAHFGFEAIGTYWVIDLFDDISESDQQRLFKAIQKRIETYDKHYSRFRQDSLITEMAQKPGTYQLPADGKKLFDLYLQIYKLTKGKVTPLIGNLLSDAGYDATYSLQPKSLRAVPDWEAALDYHFPSLTTKQPVIIDVGAAGKGYLIDIIGELLAGYDVQRFCINAGGDLLSRGVEPLPIGLENPDDTSQVIGVAQLAEGSICGSAGNRRAWGAFHHIMDPDTQRSPRHLKAVWVQAESALVADALTTCLFFVPPKQLREHFTFEYALLGEDNALERSAHFPAQFFTIQVKGNV
jgi:FAD:protein FMN transferase